MHGLKRSAMGLFKTNTTITLLQKISKTSEEAKLIVQMCDDYDKAYCSSSSLGAQQSKNFPNSNQASKKAADSKQQLQQHQQQSSSFTKKFFSSNSSDTTLSANPPQLMNGRSFSPTYYKVSKYVYSIFIITNKSYQNI